MGLLRPCHEQHERSNTILAYISIVVSLLERYCNPQHVLRHFCGLWTSFVTAEGLGTDVTHMAFRGHPVPSRLHSKQARAARSACAAATGQRLECAITCVRNDSLQC